MPGAIYYPRFRDRDLKVVIAVPSPGVWFTDFGMSLCHMLAACKTHRVGEAKSQAFQMFSSRGSILPRMRYEAVKFAMETKADYLFFVDSDHTFPPGTLHQLLMHEKDVIGANCVTKSIPASPTARAYDKTPTGKPVYSHNKEGLEKVWRLGTGMLLIRTSVLHRISPKMFEVLYKEDVNDYGGEDWRMTEEIHALGYDIWVDHDLSKHVGHIGYFNYGHQLLAEQEEAEKFYAANPDARSSEEAAEAPRILVAR